MELIDRLIPDDIRANDDLRMRSYLMLSVIGFNSIICLVGAIVFWLFVELPPEISLIPHVFLEGGVLGYLLVFCLFRLTRSYAIASNGIVAMLVMMLIGAVQITGGVQHSVMIELVFLSPAMAFLLTGLRAGIAWLLVTLLVSGVSLFADVLGIPTLQLLPADYVQLFRAGLYFVLLMMIGGALMVYELVNQRLKQTLNAEKNRYQHIAALATDSTVVTTSADALASSAGSLLDSSVQQKSAIEQLLATTEHLSESAQHNNALAEAARDAIRDAEGHVELSKADIHQLLDSMNQVMASGSAIQKINNVIDEIARQTNLLSLNAMIEAARSAAEGSGFRVVASEVGRLAERSAEAAREINALLESNLLSVQQGQALTELMHQRFEEMTRKIQPLIASAQDIANSSYEQSEAIREIARALLDIDRAVNENRYTAEQTATLAGELRGNAQKLSALVGNL